MLSKKNTYSLDIGKRALKTNQVTGEDRTGKISSWDNQALSTIQADFALQEFLGPRAELNWLLNFLIAGIILEYIK